MADISLKLLAQYGGKTITTTISDVNPQASDTVLKTFAQKLNSLTNNSYQQTQKVTTNYLDTESE